MNNRMRSRTVRRESARKNIKEAKRTVKEGRERRWEYRGQELTDREEEILAMGVMWLGNVLVATAPPLHEMVQLMVPDMLGGYMGPTMTQERLGVTVTEAQKLARVFLIAAENSPNLTHPEPPHIISLDAARDSHQGVPPKA